MARTPQSTLTCTMRSPEHAAHRLLMHSGHTSHLWLKVSPCVSFHVIHACALVSCLLSGLSSHVFLLPHPVPLPRRLMRSPLKIPCATPAWGAWSLWTMSHPSQPQILPYTRKGCVGDVPCRLIVLRHGGTVHRNVKKHSVRQVSHSRHISIVPGTLKCKCHVILCCLSMGPEGRVDLVWLLGFFGYRMNTVPLRKSPMVDVC